MWTLSSICHRLDWMVVAIITIMRYYLLLHWSAQYKLNTSIAFFCRSIRPARLVPGILWPLKSSWPSTWARPIITPYFSVDICVFADPHRMDVNRTESYAMHLWRRQMMFGLVMPAQKNWETILIILLRKNSADNCYQNGRVELQRRRHRRMQSLNQSCQLTIQTTGSRVNKLNTETINIIRNS